jgi:hypothetical protein
MSTEKGNYFAAEQHLEPKEKPFTEEKMHLENALHYAYSMFNGSNIKDGSKQICILTCCDDPIGGVVKAKVRFMHHALTTASS